MSLITLGLHVSHNSSACLFEDGRLIAAVQEERLRRIKQYEGFPSKAILFVLEKGGLTADDVDFIAIAGIHQHKENPNFVFHSTATVRKPLVEKASKFAASIKGRIQMTGLDNLIYPKEVYRDYIDNEINTLHFDRSKVEVKYFDHHMSHAASAFFPSGSRNALVFTQDGRGDFLSGTMYLGKDSMSLIYAQEASSSLAQLYAGVTMYLGFTPLKHEGKITGLAAFGKDSELNRKIQNLFEIGPNGVLLKKLKTNDIISLSSKLSLDELKIIKATADEYHDFAKFGFLFQKWLDEHASEMTREDVAFAIQDATEKILVKSVLRTLEDQGITEPIDVCLAGGIFANVKLNQRIRDCSPLVNNVFVQPAMGDEGLAIGAAILSLQENGHNCENLKDVYLGNEYSDQEIEEELEKWTNEYRFQKFDNVEVEIAKQLNDGKVVGRFNGAMEFGPRALGNRSILIHPTNKDINDIVNKRLKRTEFMPFAPSVLDFRAKDYFVGFRESDITADWMTITYDVFPERVKEIDAVVHVDKTARPQIVKEDANPSYYKILKEFNEISGLGCFVNTSFNMHEEPIIASPYDAMRAFNLGSVDILAIGSYIVWKK